MNAPATVIPIGQIFITLGFVGFALAVVIAGGLSATFLAESTPPERLRFVPNGVPMCRNSPTVCAVESTYRLDPTEPCWNCYDTLPIVLCSGEPACAYGDVPAFFEPSCARCVASNSTAITTNLTSVGAGASTVKDGTGPLLELRSSVAGRLISITQNTNDLTYALDTTVLPACSASPCAIHERLTSNGTCLQCVATNGTEFVISSVGSGDSWVSNGATGELKSARFMSGFSTASTSTELSVYLAPDVFRGCNTSCSASQVASWTGSCWECMTPSAQIPLTSTLSNVSLVSNSTQHILKGLIPSGLVTLNDTSTYVSVGVTPLTAPATTVGLQLFPTQIPYEIVSDSTQRQLFDAPAEVSFMTPGVVLGNLNSFGVQHVIYRHEKIYTNNYPDIGFPAGTVIRTHIILNVNIQTTGTSGSFYALLDGSATNIFGPHIAGGDTTTVNGAGTFACGGTSGGTTFGAVYPQFADQVYVVGTTGTTSITNPNCIAQWTQEAYVY